jgi:hypothetical protein
VGEINASQTLGPVFRVMGRTKCGGPWCRFIRKDKYRKGNMLYDPKCFRAIASSSLPLTPADDEQIDLFVQSHGPSFIQNWINIYRPLFLKSQRDAIHASTKGYRPITHYFNTIRETVSRQSRIT